MTTPSTIDLADFHRCAGVGRAELEARIAALCDELAVSRRDCKAYLTNLTAVQTRCTELLEQVRTLLACGYGKGLRR